MAGNTIDIELEEVADGTSNDNERGSVEASRSRDFFFKSVDCLKIATRASPFLSAPVSVSAAIANYTEHSMEASIVTNIGSLVLFLTNMANILQNNNSIRAKREELNSNAIPPIIGWADTAAWPMMVLNLIAVFVVITNIVLISQNKDEESSAENRFSNAILWLTLTQLGISFLGVIMALYQNR